MTEASTIQQPKFWKATDLKTGVDLTITSVAFDRDVPSITFTIDRNKWIVMLKLKSFIKRLVNRKAKNRLPGTHRTTICIAAQL